MVQVVWNAEMGDTDTTPISLRAIAQYFVFLVQSSEQPNTEIKKELISEEEKDQSSNSHANHMEIAQIKLCFLILYHISLFAHPSHPHNSSKLLKALIDTLSLLSLPLSIPTEILVHIKWLAIQAGKMTRMDRNVFKILQKFISNEIDYKLNSRETEQIKWPPSKETIQEWNTLRQIEMQKLIDTEGFENLDASHLSRVYDLSEGTDQRGKRALARKHQSTDDENDKSPIKTVHKTTATRMTSTRASKTAARLKMHGMENEEMKKLDELLEECEENMEQNVEKESEGERQSDHQTDQYEQESDNQQSEQQSEEEQDVEQPKPKRRETSTKASVKPRRATSNKSKKSTKTNVEAKRSTKLTVSKEKTTRSKTKNRPKSSDEEMSPILSTARRAKEKQLVEEMASLLEGSDD